MTVIPRFSVENLEHTAPPLARLHPQMLNTRAMRVQGPFEVERSGVVERCEDGWLARDRRGRLYAIPEPEPAAA